MNDIEKALRNTLDSIDNRINQAKIDLHESVVALAKAVESVSGGYVTVALNLVKESDASINYTLQMISLGDDEKRDLGGFIIPLTGYPIHTQNLHMTTALESKERLTNSLMNLVRDVKSPLVVYLRYILRKRQLAQKQDPIQETPGSITPSGGAPASD